MGAYQACPYAAQYMIFDSLFLYKFFLSVGGHMLFEAFISCTLTVTLLHPVPPIVLKKLFLEYKFIF